MAWQMIGIPNASAIRTRVVGEQMATNWLPRSIDRDDRALLLFALRWLPFGGAPQDEVFVEFGMDAYQFTERVADLVRRHSALIHPDTVLRLRAACSTGRRLVRREEPCAGASGA